MTSIHYYIGGWASIILAQASRFHGDPFFVYIWGTLAVLYMILAWAKLDK